MKRVIIALIFSFLIPAASFAEIYRCVDENGERTYTTKPGPNCVLLPGSVENKLETLETPVEPPKTPKTSVEKSEDGVGFFPLIIAISLIIYLISKRKRYSRIINLISKKYSNLAKRQEIKAKQMELQGIYGEKQKKYIRTFKTKVVGVTFDNDDGSSRQNAIGNLQVGQEVHLAWEPNNPYSDNAILVFGKIHMAMSSCVGHLKSDLGRDVLEWMNDDTYEGIYAEVADILGGTRGAPTFGCLIEICLY